MLQHGESFDIAIVGGGPAGAAAALSARQLRPNLRVAIVEASSYDSWRAGETLSPGCQEILRGAGMLGFLSNRPIHRVARNSLGMGRG